MSVSELEQDGESPPASKSKLIEDDILRWIVQRIIIPVIILLILWQLIASLTRITLLDVFLAFWELVTVGDSGGVFLIDHILASVGRVVIGFLVAVATGIPLGIIIGRYRTADAVLGPVVEAMRPIPPIAWIHVSVRLFS